MKSYEVNRLTELLEALKTQYQEAYLLLEEVLHDLQQEQLQRSISPEEQLPFRDDVPLSKGR